MNIAEILSEFEDDELVSKFEVAKQDLEDATNNYQNSEWHEGCFAALIIMSNEILKRGITIGTIH